jgi:hypothetical protein
MTGRKIVNFAIVLLSLINVSELLFFLRIQEEAKLYGSNIHLPIPSGYLADTSRIHDDPAHCFLLRLTSDGCPYCRLDQDEYTKLLHQAQQSGCRNIMMSPKTGQMKWNSGQDGIFQLQYVDMKFGRLLNPFITPETILLDHQGRIVWDQEGAMDEHALQDAFHALHKLR